MEAEAYVGTRAMTTFLNFTINIIEVNRFFEVFNKIFSCFDV